MPYRDWTEIYSGKADGVSWQIDRRWRTVRIDLTRQEFMYEGYCSSDSGDATIRLLSHTVLLSTISEGDFDFDNYRYKIVYGTNNLEKELTTAIYSTAMHGGIFLDEIKATTIAFKLYKMSRNVQPVLTDSTSNNRTLYEGDLLTLTGNVQDTDSGNVLSVKYSINNGTIRAIATGISDGSTPIVYSKPLIFKEGYLYDGDNKVSNQLVDGSQHIVKIWAEDDQGGKSIEKAIFFYVVNNRPATLTINPFNPRTDLINTDYITVDGTVSDPDNNNVKVSYKIANGSFIEIYNGSGGEFQFQVQLSNLVVGQNTVTIQAEDTYGAKTVKTLDINKSKNENPLKTAVARYKLSPPNGTAKGVILWLEREVGDLVVDVEISASMNGEYENFVPMTKSSVAFVKEGVEEDEWTFETDSPKENIILKITMERASTNSNKGITLISGVLS